MIWVTHSLPYELPVFSQAQSEVIMVKQVEEGSISMRNVAFQLLQQTPRLGQLAESES